MNTELDEISHLNYLRELTNKLPPMIMSPYGVDYKEYKPIGGSAFSWILHRVGNELLVQRWFVTKNSVWETHYHDGVEILYLYSGSMRIEMEGKEYIKKTGDVFYIQPNIPHTAYYFEDTKLIVITSPIEKRYTNGH